MENNLNNPIEMQAEEVYTPTPEQARKTRARKCLVVAAVLLSTLAILAAGSIAYFTAEETAYNVITTATLDMQLVEEKRDGTPFEDVFGVMPGENVDKIVYVKNIGATPFYTRIALEKKVSVDGKEMDFDRYISLDLNTEDWIEKDGYYYYKEAVQPGESTAKLFTKVKFSRNMGNAYQNARVEITVDAQAVQSKNNSDDPLKAAGWN